MKVKAPFCDLFNTTSPKEFVYLFRNEYPQTIAFILSFCQKKYFIKKVIQLLDKSEQDKLNQDNKISFVIKEYLLQCNKEKFARNFLSEIEAETSSMVSKLKSNT
ncbi:MAG: hypothetical protein FWH35_00150 [Treponema sp.]|nr:hypothetical protein [Treponema sp.]